MGMLSVQEVYRQKLVSPEQAVKIINSGDIIWMPLAGTEANILCKALCDRKDELEGVVMRQMLQGRKQPYFDPAFAPHIFIDSWFTGGAGRKHVQEGHGTFTANTFNEVPRLIRQSGRVDAVMFTAAPMDEHGYLNFGLGCDYTPAALELARKVIVEVNPNMPRTGGSNNIHISKVDYVVECNEPIIELPVAPITELEEKIGAHVAELIEDGSTLQVGVGGVPNAVCKFLEHKKDLGVHTEMVVDGLMGLVESGAVNGSKKSIHKGKFIGTFALGTKKLYNFMNNNPSIEMLPVDYTNNPYIIGQNSKMVSINATVEVDLFGQCCSESIGTVHWSGSGGQLDYARGANVCPDGKGFITLNSTAKGGTISKIVPTLTPGALVTTGKNDVDHVVTEYGVAKLRGKSMRERALALINIAHPDFRDELRHAAKKMNLI